MKVNYLAVLPAIVRYDRLLSSTSILLWAEISACSDQYGVCSENNETFSKLLNIDQRTVIRCLNQLVDNGHIIRLKDNEKRKLKVIVKHVPNPEEENLEPVENINLESVKEFTKKCLDLWEHKLNCVLEDREQYIPIFKKRLKLFTEEEILKAINNRIDYLKLSDWHLKEENKAFKIDINPVINSDQNTLKWITVN